MNADRREEFAMENPFYQTLELAVPHASIGSKMKSLFWIAMAGVCLAIVMPNGGYAQDAQLPGSACLLGYTNIESRIVRFPYFWNRSDESMIVSCPILQYTPTFGFKDLDFVQIVLRDEDGKTGCILYSGNDGKNLQSLFDGPSTNPERILQLGIRGDTLIPNFDRHDALQIVCVLGADDRILHYNWGFTE
jgi:hypothetical protein